MGIVYDLTNLYGMAEQEMGMIVESVRTMLLQMGVQHHWLHLALWQAIWVRNCLERSTLPLRTTPYKLLKGKKTDLMLARPESKGWEVLDLTDNKVVMAVEVIFYKTLSLEVWKVKYGLALVKSVSGPTREEQPVEGPTPAKQLVDDEGELSAGEEFTDSDVMEVPDEKPEQRCSGQARKLLEWLSFNPCLLPATFTTLFNNAEVDDDLPELHLDMHADLEHRWDLALTTVKEALVDAWGIGGSNGSEDQ
ncbi:unnamed protein product [Closterium sp. NIES-64]|nr:unnamed protein product [Closterium sp. NIES-64]